MEAEQSIVNPDGPQEQLLRKLESFKRKGLNSLQTASAKKCEATFVASFMNLAWSLMGLAREDLAQLTEEELRGVDNILTPIVRRTRRWLFLSPFTWIALPFVYIIYPEGDVVNCSLHYFVQLKRLKKYYGKDFYPSQAIFDKLREKKETVRPV